MVKAVNEVVHYDIVKLLPLSSIVRGVSATATPI